MEYIYICSGCSEFYGDTYSQRERKCPQCGKKTIFTGIPLDAWTKYSSGIERFELYDAAQRGHDLEACCKTFRVIWEGKTEEFTLLEILKDSPFRLLIFNENFQIWSIDECRQGMKIYKKLSAKTNMTGLLKLNWRAMYELLTEVYKAFNKELNITEIVEGNRRFGDLVIAIAHSDKAEIRRVWNCIEYEHSIPDRTIINRFPKTVSEKARALIRRGNYNG